MILWWPEVEKNKLAMVEIHSCSGCFPFFHAMQEYIRLKQAFEETSLFESKTWRISPKAWALSADQILEIEAIGQACLAFHQALENLYSRSWQDKNLLRNQPLKAPWVASYLDRGKPAALIEHERHARLKGRIPAVLRPDLLITDHGFALTELDSVPGGIGLTSFLNGLYSTSGAAGEASSDIVGSEEGMIRAFYEAIAGDCSERNFPFVAILVSDESATYRPEMEWLASQLQRMGRRVFVYHPNDLIPIDNTLCVPLEGNLQKVDVIYRFWEMFDAANIATFDHILEAWDAGEIEITPPMRPFQEEKMALGLFHHPMLEPFWKENLGKSDFRVLKRIIPHTWIVDPTPVPPCAFLDAPLVEERPIRDWMQLGAASKKERDLILKISGFHETAWGARSVVLGSDVSREEWTAAIQNAVTNPEGSFYVLQQYLKPRRIAHPVYSDDGEIQVMEGRVRLCPYYFIKSGKASVQGILSTFCPADKKIIHGMKDAALMPCRLA